MRAKRSPTNEPITAAAILRTPPSEGEEILIRLTGQGTGLSTDHWLALALSYSRRRDQVGAERAINHLADSFPAMNRLAAVWRRLTAVTASYETLDADGVLRELDLLEGADGMADSRQAADPPAPTHAAALTRAFAASLAGDATALSRALEAGSITETAVAGQLWAELLRLFATQGSIEQAEQTMERMAVRGFVPTPQEWAALMFAHVQRLGPDGGVEYVGRVLRETSVPDPNGLMAALGSMFAAECSPPTLCALIDELESSGTPSQPDLWDCALEACARREPPSCIYVYEAMNARGIQPGARGWRSLGLAAEQVGNALPTLRAAFALDRSDPVLLAALVDTAEAAEEPELLREALEAFEALTQARGAADYTPALRRLEPLLGREQTEAAVRIAGKSSDGAFRTFRAALRSLEPEHGRLAPLVVAFPRLLSERDALFLADRIDDQQIREQATSDLLLVHPGLKETLHERHLAQALEFAADIFRIDLSRGRSFEEVEDAAQAGEFDAMHLMRLYASACNDMPALERWKERMRAADRASNLIREEIMFLLTDPDNDDRESLQILHTAAQNGSADAAYFLGSLALGEGRTRQAAANWEHAAALGSRDAPGALATLYAELPEGSTQAMRWARAACDLDDPLGFRLAGHFAMRDGDEERAAQLLRRCLELGGGPNVHSMLALVLRRIGRNDEAVDTLLEGAAHADAQAIADIWELHRLTGDAETDPWRRRAAALGNADAALDLGLWLLGKRRSAEAEYWLRKAATEDDAGAGPALVRLYELIGSHDDADRWREWTHRHARPVTSLAERLARKWESAEGSAVRPDTSELPEADAAESPQTTTDTASAPDSHEEPDSRADLMAVLTEAENVAHSLADSPAGRVWALAEIGKVADSVNPVYALNLLRQTAAMAHALSDTKPRKGWLLAAVADGLTRSDPELATDLLTAAERFAYTIPEDESYGVVETLAEVVRVLARLNPARAERLVYAIADDVGMNEAEALAETAGCLARQSAAYALRVVRTLRSTYCRESATIAAAKTLAEHDHEGAEEFVRALFATSDPDTSLLEPLAEIAKTVAARDPNLALRLLADLPRADHEVYYKVQYDGLVAISRHVAGRDEAQARHLLAMAELQAAAIPQDTEKAAAFVNLATALTGHDSAHARELLADAESLARATGSHLLLVKIAAGLAALDPASAERLARTISDPQWQTDALTEVAVSIANSNPNESLRIARTISGAVWRARALTAVVRARCGDCKLNLQSLA